MELGRAYGLVWRDRVCGCGLADGGGWNGCFGGHVSKSKLKSKKDSVTLTKEGFMALILFVVAITIFMVYAFLNYGGVK